MPSINKTLLIAVLCLSSGCYQESEADAIARIERGPYLQRLASDQVTLCWRTRSALLGTVEYGLSPDALSSSTSEANAKTDHEVRVEGLLPDTLYYYALTASSVGDSDHASTHSFRTSAAALRSPSVSGTGLTTTRIWAIGDSGLDSSASYRVRDAFAALEGSLDTDVWITMGDNAYLDGTDKDYQLGFFKKYEELLAELCIWPSAGNHDYHVQDAAVLQNIFALPTQAEAGGLPSGSELYYSFDRGNVHFIALDSNGATSSQDLPMMDWLEEDLQATEQAWVIAYLHHPPYTKGSHDSDSEDLLIKVRRDFLPLLEQHGVDLVLGGHSHAYERSALIDGHYGSSDTFEPSMLLDAGDGNPLGDGAYEKTSGAHGGTVYVVAGSASKLSSEGSLEHPALHLGLRRYGSVVISVTGLELDLRFIDEDGVEADRFQIIKDGGNESALLSTPPPVRSATVAALNDYGRIAVQQPASVVLLRSALGSRARGRGSYRGSGQTSDALGAAPHPALALLIPFRLWCPCFSLPETEDDDDSTEAGTEPALPCLLHGSEPCAPEWNQWIEWLWMKSD